MSLTSLLPGLQDYLRRRDGCDWIGPSGSLAARSTTTIRSLLASCTLDRLKAAGRDVELTEYATASHAFDNPLGAQPAAVLPKFESVRDCTIQEGADGVLINAETQRAFTYKDSCVVHGPHLGYDPAATKASKAAVKTFLRTTLKLE